MAKLTLTPDATFKSKVAVPVPGGVADVVFTFKYRDRDELQKWFKDSRKATDEEVIIDVAEGWDLDDEFNAESIKKLCTKYPGAGFAITKHYAAELAGIREGN